MLTPIRSSPSAFRLSRAVAARGRATPPPGTMPSLDRRARSIERIFPAAFFRMALVYYGEEATAHASDPIHLELVDFLAGGTTPEAIADFHLSTKAQRRVAELLEHEGQASQTADESPWPKLERA
jgi:hypothetical protein